MARRKLTNAQVLAIRESDESFPVLADRYGVTWSTIKSVRSGLSYAHVDSPPSVANRVCLCGRRFRPLGAWNYLCGSCTARANAEGGLPEGWAEAGESADFGDKIEVSPNASDSDNGCPVARPAQSFWSRKKTNKPGFGQRSPNREAALDEAMELGGADD